MALQTTAERIAAYIQLRNHKQASEKAFKDSMLRVNEAMAKLEAELLDDLNKAGTDSVAVKGIGTAYRITRRNASVQDSEAFMGFVRERELWELMEPKASKEAVKDFMDTHGEPVPGVNYTVDSTIGIRKS